MIDWFSQQDVFKMVGILETGNDYVLIKAV